MYVNRNDYDFQLRKDVLFMSSSSHLPLTSTLLIVAALAGGGVAANTLITLPTTVNAASDADAAPVYTDYSTFKPIA